MTSQLREIYLDFRAGGCFSHCKHLHFLVTLKGPHILYPQIQHMVCPFSFFFFFFSIKYDYSPSFHKISQDRLGAALLMNAFAGK